MPNDDLYKLTAAAAIALLNRGEVSPLELVEAAGPRRIMKRMSRHMQIFAITHLPQVASKGMYHFKVYKEDIDEVTRTQIKLLSEEERIVELAEMLGGKSLTDSALAHARQLLN